MTFTRDALKLDINFWSARHNNAGEHVQLEIVPALFSLALASAGNGKGGIASVPALLEQSCEGEPGYTVRHDIFGETKTWIDGRKREPVVKRSNRCNVYGVDEQKFKALVSFLDEHVVTWVERMQREDDVVALIERQTKSNAKSLLDGAFAAYVEMAFPALDVRARLTDVIESRR